MMFLSMKSLGNIIPAIKETFFRFPLPFICALSASALASLLVHEVEFIDDTFIAKCMTSFIYGVVALTSAKLLAESKNWSVLNHLFASTAVILTIILYVWEVIVESSPTTHIFFSLAIGSSLLFAPYIKRTSGSASVWYFNYQTGVAIFFGGLSAVILGSGLSLILVSIEYLFEIDVESEIYGDIWILSWGCLFCIYVLSGIAKEFDYEDEGCTFPKGVSFIANYILVPMMYAYMAILYTYFIKIILQWELPRGNLGWMITTFGTIGIATKLIAYPIRNEGTRLLVLFDRYYYYALIVPIILLAIAVGVRINDYGITEQRYAAALLGVWFSIVTIITIAKKDQHNIKQIPMILAVLAIVATFGPWSAINLSINSQLDRFESLLTKHKLLINGKAVKATDKVSFTDRKTMSSIADYLSQRDKSLNQITPWFEPLLPKNVKLEKFSDRNARAHQMIELLGITYVDEWDNEKNANDFSYSLRNPYNNIIKVTGYDYTANASYYGQGKKKYNIYRNGKEEKITAQLTNNSLIVRLESGDEAKLNLSNLVKRLKKSGKSKIELKNYKNLVLNKQSENGSFKAGALVKSINGEIINEKSVDINSIHLTLMIKFNN